MECREQHSTAARVPNYYSSAAINNWHFLTALNRASITSLHLIVVPGHEKGCSNTSGRWWCVGFLWKQISPLICTRGSRKEHHCDITHQGILCGSCMWYNSFDYVGSIDFACVGPAYRSGSHHTSRSNTRECNDLYSWFRRYVRRLLCHTSVNWCAS